MSRPHYTDSDLRSLQAYIDANGTSDGWKPAPKKRRKNEESRAQQATVKWWAYACKGFGLPVFALIGHPNQGARSPANGARMKAEGARKGTLDMQLTVSRGGFHGLWIENKTETGRVMPEQIEQRNHLIFQGYAVVICRSSEEAISQIKTYLNLT